MDKQQKKQSQVEGEGSYTATHNYQEGLEKSVKEGRADELARKAQQALDGEEAESLRTAEKAAKNGKKAPAQKK